ncbi:MAG: NAD-dependent epimerase/dehydratase family protein [Pseudomonadota bacterium]|nr:NAD-dependent epimerase/dehydratase family protein [Pseudomonadota bacterium]MDE3038426.1 NAD-dependent epimerase/dehydratase family protein [Pseudomonadota bacterium]
MQYLVTGGCGFIGSHLVERLLADGHAVTVIDDLSTGKRENLPAAVTLVTGDITAPGIFDKLIMQADGCFHLAAIVSVPLSATAWLKTHQVNLGGTVALLDALARAKRRLPVVYASSAAVYGDNTDVPLRETMPCRPLSAYGADKLGCELHAGVGIALHGIPAIGLRFFNVYGPRQDTSSPYSGVITIFANRIRRRQPAIIYGDGSQARDFIYVGDIVDGMMAAMGKLEAKPQVTGVFNLCTGVPTSINRLAAIIADTAHMQSEIVHADPRSGDICMSVGDPAQASERLDWRAATALQDGLARTLASL